MLLGAVLLEDSASIEQLTNSLNDFLLASCLCELDLVPWLVETLVARLKTLAAEFSTLVPESLYLPAPPVYCPQPTPTNEVRIVVTLIDFWQGLILRYDT